MSQQSHDIASLLRTAGHSEEAIAPLLSFFAGDAAPTAAIGARLAICRGCAEFNGTTGVINGRAIWTVSCRRCGCGGLRLRDGVCPAGKWPMST